MWLELKMDSRSVTEIKSEVPHEKSWKICKNPAGIVVEYNLPDLWYKKKFVQK